jgi:signal transduction histidine kinase
MKPGSSPGTLDVLLGLGVASTVSLVIAADVGQARPDPLAYLWAIGLGGLMLVRRRYPVIVVVMSVGAVIAYYAAGYPPIGVAVPVAAAVFSAAECGRIAAAVIACVAVVGVSVAYRLLTGQDWAFVLGYDLPGHVLLLAAAVALGDSIRSRREARRQAARVAELIEERHARAAEDKVMAERLAIARDLHDSVGHALAVVALHTEVAQESVGIDEDAVHRSHRVILQTSTSTLADLRRTVAGLRRGDGLPRSTLRLTDLDSALRPAQEAGISVQHRVEVTSMLEPAVESAVYRIVQESITNVVRHCAAGRVDVQIREREGVVEVSVVDDGGSSQPGRRGAPAGCGHGITGMRERALSLGGTFSAGPEDRGFAVRASIPLARGT